MDGSFIIHENPKIQPVFAKISFWEPYGSQNEKVCGIFYLMYDEKNTHPYPDVSNVCISLIR